MAEVKLTILGEDKSSAVVTNWENKVKSAITSVKGVIGALGITLASLSIAKVFEAGVKAVDDFQQSVIKTAAIITSLQGGNNIAENYKLAKDYAVGLQDALMEVDARTSLNLTNLNQITEEMVKQGVVLDVNNKKQVEAFTSLANAVAVYSQNGAQEVQVRQEVRALMLGEVDANSQLSSMLQKTVDGPLKEKVKQWKESGTLVEELGKRLSGFNAAAGDISDTWSAIKSTMETILTRILRGGFSEIVRDIVGYGQKLGDYLKEHEQIIGNRIKQGWLAVKGTAEGIYNLFVNHKGDLTIIGQLVGSIVKGWGLLLYAVFPPLMQRVGAFVGALWESTKLIGNMAALAANLVAGQFSLAGQSWNNMKGNWQKSGELTAQAFAGGFGDEVAKRSGEFLALDNVIKSSKATVATPQIKTAPDMAEMTKQFKERAKDIIAIEKERISVLIDMEKEYLKEVTASYQSHVDELQKFVDATRAVYQSMADRDKAEADRRAELQRGPEDGLNRYKRLQGELLAEESKIDGTWADPAEKIKRYNELITTASTYNKTVTDGNDEIISAAEVERDYLETKIRLTDKIRNVVEAETRAKEAAAMKDAENMMAAESRIRGYENSIQTLAGMIRNLPQMKTIDINLRVNGIQDLYSVTALMKNTGVNQQGVSYGDYYTQGGNTYWNDGTLAEDGTSTAEGRASGGPVKSYATYRINEDGTEYLTMGNKGGFITPAGQTPAGNSVSFGDINITVQGGGNASEIGREVSRQLYTQFQTMTSRTRTA